MLSGDDSYLTNHKLNTESVVFEVGGYTWVFSDVILQKYDCYMYIFEPVREYYDILKNKYRNNDKIKIFNFGLSNKNEEISIGKSHDWSSVFKKSWQHEMVQLVDFDTFVSQEDIGDKKFDLISINIEGGEYDLLERILQTSPHMMQSIQVQFHDFVPNAGEKRDRILLLLEKNGYKKGYSFPFVWEFFTQK